jgi:hypothetical protein
MRPEKQDAGCAGGTELELKHCRINQLPQPKLRQ